MNARQAADVERMWLEGVTVRDIAVATGVSSHTVSGHVRRNRDRLGRRSVGAKPALSDGQVRRLLAAKAKGVPDGVLAKRYGISERTVQRYATRARRGDDTD